MHWAPSAMYTDVDAEQQRGTGASQQRSSSNGSSDKRSQQPELDSPPPHPASLSADQEWTVHDGALLVDGADGPDLSSPL